MGQLEPQPVFSRTADDFFQAERQVRSHCTLALRQALQILAGYAQAGGSHSHGNTEGFKILLEAHTGVGRAFHSHDFLPQLLSRRSTS